MRITKLTLLVALVMGGCLSWFTAAAVTPTKGKLKALALVIDYPDNPLDASIPAHYFDSLLNGRNFHDYGAHGSLRHYYLENSYNQLEFDFTVIRYTTPNNAAYYNDRGGITAAAEELFAKLDAGTFPGFSGRFPFADFASDGKIVDVFCLFATAYNPGGGAYQPAVITTKKYGGVNFAGYVGLSTYRNATMQPMSVGVICHEVGHALGAPDYYATQVGTAIYDNTFYSGTAKWDIMCNPYEDGGNRPPHFSMYQKIRFGWVTPAELTASMEVRNMKNSAEHPEAYIYRTTNPGEFYVIENRQKIGFDASVPAAGMLIYRVYEPYVDNLKANNKFPQGCSPVCAATTFPRPFQASIYPNVGADPGYSSYGTIDQINSSGCVYPGTTGKTSFTDNTIPSSVDYAGNKTGMPITNISHDAVNGLVSFDFMKECTPITGLTASTQDKNITITWTYNEASQTDFKYFKIFRDNILLTTTNEKSFSETLAKDTTYTYRIHAVTDGDCESRAELAVALTRITMQPKGSDGENFCPDTPRTLSVTAQGDDLRYQWQIQQSDETWNDIAGATSAQYTTAVSGVYRVQVTGTYGEKTSNAVNFYYATYIMKQPLGATVMAGQDYTFTVMAGGVAYEMLYKWYFNGTWLQNDMTNKNYTVTNATAADKGSYYVEITSLFCPGVKTTSETVMLDVKDQPELSLLRVNGKELTSEDGTNYMYVIPCGEELNSIQVEALSMSGTTVTINGQPSPYVFTSSATTHLLPILVNAPGGKTRSYTLLITQAFPSNIIVQTFNDVLEVISLPANNGGYTFTAWQWLENGQELAGETKPVLYRPGSVLSRNSYTVRLTGSKTGSPAFTSETCPMTPSPVVGMSTQRLYPNPVKAGQILTLETGVGITQRDEVTVNIYTLSGNLVKQVKTTDAVCSLNAPAAEGYYLVNIQRGTKKIKTFNLLVIK